MTEFAIQKDATSQEKKFRLMGPNGNFYLSSVPGNFGGHKGLRIYGHLNCPSARRAIEQGGYIQSRVFFANEADAIAAGFRPCGCCMPEEFQKWKKKQFVQNSEEKSNSEKQLNLAL